MVAYLELAKGQADLLHSPVTFISLRQKFCVCTLALKEQNWPLSCCHINSSLIDMVLVRGGGADFATYRLSSLMFRDAPGSSHGARSRLLQALGDCSLALQDTTTRSDGVRLVARWKAAARRVRQLC